MSVKKPAAQKFNLNWYPIIRSLREVAPGGTVGTPKIILVGCEIEEEKKLQYKE